MFTVLTRVVEKTAAYLCVLMEFIMDSLKKDGDLDGCEIIRQWSDCGPHCRAVRTLAHAGAYWPAKYHKSFHIIWGPEEHMKGLIDAHFSQVEHGLGRAAGQTDLLDMLDCVKALTSVFEARKEISSWNLFE